MAIDWDEVEKAVSPVKSFAVMLAGFDESFAFPFVRKVFNASMPALAEYTRRGVGSDPQGRYVEYAASLVKVLNALHTAGVRDVMDLLDKAGTREKMVDFSTGTGLSAKEVAGVLKYLYYWFIPRKKLLSGLVRFEPGTLNAIQVLAARGVRTNLELLEQGRTRAGRLQLADRTGIEEPVIEALVHRADLSRMPWSSRATISNILGAGYGSLAALAGADPGKLAADYFRYGNSINRNLKIGNEIWNSHRLAKIIPVIVI